MACFTGVLYSVEITRATTDIVKNFDHIFIVLYFSEGPVRPNTSPQVKREFELDYEQIKGGKDIIKGVKPKLIEVDVDDDDFTIAKPL